MEVFKFGGASVKDAEGVINLVDILSKKKISKDNHNCFCDGKVDKRS